jgi:hypothetical protein
MIKPRIFVFVLLVAFYSSVLKAELNIYGYFENRFFLLNQTDISWKNTREKFSLGDYNRLRLKYQASPSKKVTVNIALDFFSFHGILSSPLGTYDSESGAAANQSNANQTVKIDLDRAYVNLYFKKFDIIVGKQRVAMGVSYLWAPLDVFNRVNVFEPKEEKPGTNAIKVYVPLGSASSITGVFSPDNKFHTSRSGVRGQTQVLGVDIGATLIRSGDIGATIYGLDLRGENFIGWWFEGAFYETQEKGETKLVLGFDYTFPIKNGVYWLNELYFDSSGQESGIPYDYNLLLSGQRFTLGRKYLFSMLRYGVNEFLSVSLSYIGNLEDSSYVIYPSLGYDISQDISISAGFYFPMGKKEGEFNINKRSMFFVWLKVNF